MSSERLQQSVCLNESLLDQANPLRRRKHGQLATLPVQHAVSSGWLVNVDHRYADRILKLLR